ncbi:MAG: polyprenyl synthetase family protein [Eubacterium sp.]|nr:polyprenyl synthetase family protein [Eubacterium sp.]
MNYTEIVEEIIKRYLPSEDAPSDVPKAMNYAIEAGGKRVRPVLVYLTYMANNKDGSDASEEFKLMVEPFISAIEMIHTYSLIHDDLPAMDDDTMRRGRPTVHVQFNESTAILAGDALLNYSMEVVSKAMCSVADMVEKGELSSKALINCCRAEKVLYQKAGIDGMIGGQGLDVQLSGHIVRDMDRDYIYKNKTCALIEASFMMGAILAGADETTVNAFERAGEAVGMAFQVQDDILDIIGDAEKLGKEVHQDERNQKNTFVASFGIEKSKEYLNTESEKAVRLIEKTVGESVYRDALLDLVRMLTKRDY